MITILSVVPPCSHQSRIGDEADDVKINFLFNSSLLFSIRFLLLSF